MDDLEIKPEYREVKPGQLYLERVEAAGMETLTQSIRDRKW